MVARAPLTRRAVLGLAGLGLLATACGDDGGSDEVRVRYGAQPDQFGRLGLPDGEPAGLAVLVHGGFWLDQYGLDLMDPLAADLRQRGWATWNVEYRRVGTGGGYPSTLDDIAAAFDQVPDLDIDPPLRTVSIGHSAGGHLATWAASRTAATPGGRAAFVPDLTVSLSGVLCLTAADRDRVGNGAATTFLGGPAVGERASDYALADPVRLLPPQGRVVAVHAEEDQAVPPEQSREYVTAARAAGADADLVLVPGDHFALIDPGSDAWARVVGLIG